MFPARWKKRARAHLTLVCAEEIPSAVNARDVRRAMFPWYLFVNCEVRRGLGIGSGRNRASSTFYRSAAGRHLFQTMPSRRLNIEKSNWRPPVSRSLLSRRSRIDVHQTSLLDLISDSLPISLAGSEGWGAGQHGGVA